MDTVDVEAGRVGDGGRVVGHPAREVAAVRLRDAADAEGAGEVVVLAHRDVVGAGRQHAAVLEPREGQRQVAGHHHALDAGAFAHVQVPAERERRDFGRN